MNRLVLGVIGHVDHGKTALVHALTGQDTDRLPEEKRRGISIALGFAHLDTSSGARIDLIDMPGHERFVRTMVAGATGIDAVLLVVAATEGIKPQTVEHANIAGLLGLRRAVIAIAKTDLVAPQQARRVAAEVLHLLEHIGLDASPPVFTSARDGSGIAELKHALAALAAEREHRAAGGLAYLPIDRAFGIPGHGPVVTGTLRGAGISRGDTLELLPPCRTVRVRGVQVHGRTAPAAAPGQRVAINLRDIEVSELERGMVLAAPASLAPSNWLTLSIRSVDDAPPIENGKSLRALLGTSELTTRLRLLDCNVLEPGHSGFVQLHCATPVALPTGEHAILRLASPPRTLAGGRVLESVTQRRRRNDAETLKRLENLRDLAADDMLLAEIRRVGAAGTTLPHLSRLSALSAERIAHALHGRIVTGRSGLVVDRVEMEYLLARIPALLSPHTGGLSRGELLAALPGVGRAVLDAAIGRLQGRGTVVERGSRLMLPNPDEDRRRARDDADLAARIASNLLDSGLTPPNPSDVMVDAPTRRAVNRLIGSGLVIRAEDRSKRRELLFHRESIEQAKRRLAPLLERGPGLRVSEVASALGVSRKYVMPLLDHLDSVGFTCRIEDRRVLSLTKGHAARGISMAKARERERHETPEEPV